MKPWKLKQKKIILDHSKFLRVDEHELELPDGRIIHDWPIVITPDYVNILACDTEGLFLFFQQTKYMAPKMQLSPPGGYLDPGEEPLAAAKRELLEETGYASNEWVHLGSFVVDSNRGCGIAHLFLAINALKIADLHADDLEDQVFKKLTRAELETAIKENACPILSAAALFSLGLRHLDRT